MQRCLHKCTAPRDLPLPRQQAREPTARCVEDPPALASVWACASVRERAGKAERGTAGGGRTRARSLSRQALLRVSDRVYRREGQGHQVSGFRGGVGFAGIQRRDPPWAVQSWLSKLGAPSSSPRALARPQARGLALSPLSARRRRPPGGAEGRGSGFGD